MYDWQGERELLAVAEGRAVVCSCSTRGRHDTYIAGYIQSPLRCEVNTDLPVITLVVGVAVGRTVLNPRRAAVASRVTDYIQQGDACLGSGQLVALGYITHHEGAKRIGLYGVTFLLQRNADSAKSIIAVGLRLYMIDREPNVAVLTLIVELEDGAVGGVVHAVAYGDLATALRYAVQALRGIVVVVVILIRLRLELVTAVVVEQRVAQGVTDRTVLLFAVELEALLHVRIDAVHAQALLTVAVLLHAVQQLLEEHLNRRAVDAVIHGIVMHAVVLVYYIVRLQRSVGQVESLVTRTGSKQGSITECRRLNDLVLDGVQIDRILTRLRVGMDDNALFLEQGVRSTDGLKRPWATGVTWATCPNLVRYLLLERITAQVIGVVNEAGHVIALELQHELQAVAEVVRTQAESCRQVALVYTAGYTAHEAHLSQVVEPYAIQRLGQSKRFFPVLHAQYTISFESVSGFEDTQRISLVLVQSQLECSVGSRLQRCAVAQHSVAVEGEHCTGYRDR